MLDQMGYKDIDRKAIERDEDDDRFDDDDLHHHNHRDYDYHMRISECLYFLS